MEKELITIELEGAEMDDGRTYITSPSLEGFHYVLEANEDPEVMNPDLIAFVKLYLRAEIAGLIKTDTPKGYRQRSVEPRLRRRNYSYVAEIAGAAAA